MNGKLPNTYTQRSYPKVQKTEGQLDPVTSRIRPLPSFFSHLVP